MDDERDALAAEYVLGTLSADERDQAEALIAIDQGFADTVRQWERRLGELNVMVEAVEPPTDMWERIRAEIEASGSGGAAAATVAPQVAAAAATASETPAIAEGSTSEPAAEAPAVASEALALESSPPPEPSLESSPPAAAEPSEPVPDLSHFMQEAPLHENSEAADDLVPDLLASPDEDKQEEDGAAIATLASSLVPSSPDVEAERSAAWRSGRPHAAPPRVEQAVDTAALARMRRWRNLAVAASALAAVLLLYVAAARLAPDVLSVGRSTAPATAPVQAPAARFVAALQQEPTGPAFLLTIDPQSRTLTVRTVSAAPENGRSYELWLMSGKSGSPRSLGVIGNEEFTRRPLPANIDLDTLRAASYAVSLEPAGGSAKGVPTGPILFTGKLVDALPSAPNHG